MSGEEQNKQDEQDPFEAAANNAANEKSMHRPYEPIDMQYLQIESAYGKEVPTDYYNLMEKKVYIYERDNKGKPKRDANGKLIVTERTIHYTDYQGMFTRDMRSGNLDSEGEVVSKHYLKIAADLLPLGCAGASILAHNKAAVELEISQSRQGFFRNTFNTVRQIKENTEKDGRSKSLFGKDKQ